MILIFSDFSHRWSCDILWCQEKLLWIVDFLSLTIFLESISNGQVHCPIQQIRIWDSYSSWKCHVIINSIMIFYQAGKLLVLGVSFYKWVLFWFFFEVKSVNLQYLFHLPPFFHHNRSFCFYTWLLRKRPQFSTFFAARWLGLATQMWEEVICVSWIIP